MTRPISLTPFPAFVEETELIDAPSSPEENATFERQRQKELYTLLPVQPTDSSTELEPPQPLPAPWKTGSSVAPDTNATAPAPTPPAPSYVVPRVTTPDSHIVVDVSFKKSTLPPTFMSATSPRHMTSPRHESSSVYIESGTRGQAPAHQQHLPWNSAIGSKTSVTRSNQRLDTATTGNMAAWISNYIHYSMWDKITYPLPNFNSCTIEVCE